MRLAIYTTATEGYTHALKAQARKVAACLAVCNHPIEKVLIMVVSNSLECIQPAIELYKKILPKAEIEPIVEESFGTGFENYKVDAQLLIAQMRTAATIQALAWEADYCLSLDCDVLPPPNAIRCMIDMICFDGGYGQFYDVAFCPYTSHSGGAFMGGRGTNRHHILPDFYSDEREVPLEISEELKLLTQNPNENGERIQKIKEIIESCPPQGNVFSANAKSGWRPRGWLDFAYPAIGRGSVVPIDWSGFGCTMMSRKALALCDWTGYLGLGTEDLFINFKRWKPANIEMACIPHCACDHVVRHPTRKGEFVHIFAGHEQEGEQYGHLRSVPLPWYSQEPGERFRPENDGSLSRQSPQPDNQLTLPFEKGFEKLQKDEREVVK